MYVCERAAKLDVGARLEASSILRARFPKYANRFKCPLIG